MRLGDDDTVAARGFATIEGLVCAAQDGVEVQIRADELSDTRCEGYVDASGGKSDGG